MRVRKSAEITKFWKEETIPLKEIHISNQDPYPDSINLLISDLTISLLLQPLTMKHKLSKRVISLKWVPFLCISFFAFGAIFTSRSFAPSSDSGSQLI